MLTRDTGGLEEGAMTAEDSIAISLKRIADTMANGHEDFRLAIYNGISEGIFASRPKG